MLNKVRFELNCDLELNEYHILLASPLPPNQLVKGMERRQFYIKPLTNLHQI